MPIRRLPPVLIDRIAAGAGMKRPAAGVKEWVEAAIDAGALAVERGAGARVALESGKEFPYNQGCSPGDEPVITSKMTSKAQTTIPQPVRAALKLREGDEIAYRIEDGRVILTKAEPATADDPFATFSEWDSDADRKAYAKL